MVRIDKALGHLYEADPRHTDLITDAMGLELGSSVKTPGVKPVDTSAKAPNGEERAQHGLVVDIDGHVYDAGYATRASATSQHNNDKSAVLANALALERSLQDVMNDTNLGGKPIAQTDNTTTVKVKSTKFHKYVDYVPVHAYSGQYERHPRRSMTTDNGVWVVSCQLDAFTSMFSDVMTTRRLKHPFSNPDRVHAHYHDILGTRVTTEPHHKTRVDPATPSMISCKSDRNSDVRKAAIGDVQHTLALLQMCYDF